MSFSIGRDNKKRYIKVFISNRINRKQLHKTLDKAIDEVIELKKVEKEMYDLIPNLDEILKKK